MTQHDPYSRVDYRQLIAWPERIRREWPLIEEILRSAPVKRLLDLGSGTGEHARQIAEHGFEVVGVDSSESMIEKSRELPAAGVEFVHGDFRELERDTQGTFGAAICLGNALPHLRSESDIDALARGLAARLAPRSPLLVQLLNYQRVFAKKERALPINLRPDPEEGEIVFLRLMTPRDDGSVLFFPTTLRLRPDHEPPVEVVASRRVELRGWLRPELERIFSNHGFGRFRAWGGFDRAQYDPLESRDLLLLAVRG